MGNEARGWGQKTWGWEAGGWGQGLRLTNSKEDLN